MLTIVSNLLRGAVVAAMLGAAALPVAAQDRIEGSTLDGATFSLSSAWIAGQPLTLKGENWTNHDGNRGSVIGVKYDFGDTVPTDPVDEIDDLWLRITAGNDGAFEVQLPYPEDAGWEAGESHTIHLLTGSLGNNDKVRNPTLRVIIAPAE